MQKKKRFLALLLALVVALPFIQSPLIAQAAGEGSVTRKITVVKGKDINDMQYDGKNVLHSSAWWYDEDGTKNPAFCVDPKLAGPGRSGEIYITKLAYAEQITISGELPADAEKMGSTVTE